MNLSQKIIVVVAAFVVTFVSICTFFKNDIRFLLTSKKVERNYGKTQENRYFTIDEFDFVNNYEEAEVHSKQEIIDSIYYLINSGVSYSERYCARDYVDCYRDMEEVSADTNLLSVLNNYVHPYNSFDNIVFNFDERVIQIEINHAYSKDEIQQLSSKVDQLIEENVDRSLPTKEQIRVIHDYIINHTEYDKLKTENINDTTYKSNTAYGVLFEGYGICSGYSDAMKLFLDKLNIINYKISNDQHIWNLVNLDGVWYHLDLTWDDPVSDKNITRDSYFMITTKNLKALDDDVHYYNTILFKEAI